jgi:hypothetical protein
MNKSPCLLRFAWLDASRPARAACRAFHHPVRAQGLHRPQASFPRLWKREARRSGGVRPPRGRGAPSARLLQIRAFFRQDRPLNRTHLQADAAIDAGVEINPVEVRSLAVRPFARVNAGHGARVNAISDAFTDVGDDRMSHGALVSARTLGSQPQGAGAAPGRSDPIGLGLTGKGTRVQFRRQTLEMELALGVEG